MKYLKRFLSLLALAFVIGAVFNFISHGSIFPRLPSGAKHLTEGSCEMHLKNSFIEKSKEKGNYINYERLDVVAKQVCDCARNRAKYQHQLEKMVVQCINEL